MATLEQCRSAIDTLAARLGQADADDRRDQLLDRTLSCRIPDLDVTFSGRLKEGHIRDVTTAPSPKAQIRLTVNSDDLIALVDGELNFGQAWLNRRLKVDASFLDLLKLRELM
jgi:hypothetical protein